MNARTLALPSPRRHWFTGFWAGVTIGGSSQTLQQSRGFGNDFKFPEGGVGGGAPTAGPGAFAATQPAAADDDDDLYN